MRHGLDRHFLFRFAWIPCYGSWKLYCTSELHQSQARFNSLAAERHSLHIPTLKFLVSSLKMVCSGKIIREKLGLWHGALKFYNSGNHVTLQGARVDLVSQGLLHIASIFQKFTTRSLMEVGQVFESQIRSQLPLPKRFYSTNEIRTCCQIQWL